MGCGSSTAATQAVVTSPGAKPSGSVFQLKPNTLDSIKGTPAFGPYLRMRSYDQQRQQYALSVLVVVHEDLKQVILPKMRVEDGGATTVTEGEMVSSWRSYEFWRFPINTTTRAAARQVTYQVDLGLPDSPACKAYSFTVPAADESWKYAFYSCNGVHLPELEAKTMGIEPMWKDVIARHNASPFHVMVGGGDQLYNDGVFKVPELAKLKHRTAKETEAMVTMPFTSSMKDSVEEFYAVSYLRHFGRAGFAQALATIPSLMTWDDHDIFDGYGSYPALINNSPILQGIFAAAKQMYLLFQQHSTEKRLEKDGMWGGASSQLVCLGNSTALLMLDTRWHRTIDQIVPPVVWDEAFERLHELPETVRNVVFVAPVPVLYPKLDVQLVLNKLGQKAQSGSGLISQIMQKTGLASKITLTFGQQELLDDLIDHWDSRTHVAERDQMLKRFAALAASRSVRVHLLSGDVHVAGYGQLFTESTSSIDRDDPELPLAIDAKFIPQIISSAIGNEPPPEFVIDALEAIGSRTEKAAGGCKWRMVEQFGDKRLWGGRNWCEVTEDETHNTLYSLRCEASLGTGDILVSNIAIPALRKK